VNLLCVHQAFEGATVGPSGFTFRSGDDVVKAADVPSAFAAVLAGHIHRHQILTADLEGQPLPTPVLYPGSIERTSIAEKDEPKGYLFLEVGPGGSPGGVLRRWEFRHLPARPMLTLELHADGADRRQLRTLLVEAIGEVPEDAVVRLRIHGRLATEARAVLGAASLRSVAPTTMNVEAELVEEGRPPRDGDGIR
jgi:DNA repair exonuclease SbcCD nuclease subunit